jgi:hedgehog interacting protein
MVNHIIKRWEGATEPHNITKLQNKGEFRVKGTLSTKAYLVQFGNQSIYPSCQCLDWQKHRLPCKHFCAIFQHTQWKWESLSSLYKNNPLFCLDDLCFAETGSLINHKLPEKEQIQHNNKNENGHAIDPVDGGSQVADTRNHDGTSDYDPIQMKLDQHSDERFTELPPRKVFKTTQHKKKCREILKQLTSATYLLKDISSIQNLERSLCKIWDDVKESLPSDCNGLALETNDKPKPKRKAASPIEENNAARKRRKIQQLPKGKYGRPKHRYTGRVGQSAEMLRKTYKVNIPIRSFNTSGTLPKSENNSSKDRPKTWIADLHLSQ